MNQENIAALFGVIYDKYYKKILRFFRRDFAVEDAEDLPQQAFCAFGHGCRRRIP